MEPSTSAAGGSASAFPRTRPSLVEAIRAEDPVARGAAYAALIEAYWKPVYKYVRLRHGRTREDAEDLTQAFFARAFERGFLQSFDPTRARFRTFLRVTIDRLAINESHATSAEKRGGGEPRVRFDFAAAEGELGSREPVAADRAAEYFESEWRRALIESALHDLREDCAQRGRPLRFALFARIEIDPPDPRPSYAELAASHGVDVVTVTNELAAARREFRRALLDRLRALTTSEEEFQDELRALMGSGA